MGPTQFVRWWTQSAMLSSELGVHEQWALGSHSQIPLNPFSGWITHLTPPSGLRARPVCTRRFRKPESCLQFPPMVSTARVMLTASPLSLVQAHFADSAGPPNSLLTSESWPSTCCALDYSSERPSSAGPECELSHQ